MTYRRTPQTFILGTVLVVWQSIAAVLVPPVAIALFAFGAGDDGEVRLGTGAQVVVLLAIFAFGVTHLWWLWALNREPSRTRLAVVVGLLAGSPFLLWYDAWLNDEPVRVVPGLVLPVLAALLLLSPPSWRFASQGSPPDLA